MSETGKIVKLGGVYYGIITNDPSIECGFGDCCAHSFHNGYSISSSHLMSSISDRCMGLYCINKRRIKVALIRTNRNGR